MKPLWLRLWELGELTPGHPAMVRGLEELPAPNFLDVEELKFFRWGAKGLLNRLRLVEADPVLIEETATFLRDKIELAAFSQSLYPSSARSPARP